MVLSEIIPSKRPTDFPQCEGCLKADDAISTALLDRTGIVRIEVACKPIDRKPQMVAIDVNLYEASGEEGRIPFSAHRSITLCPGRVAQANAGRTDMSNMLT